MLNFDAIGQEFTMHVNLSSKDEIDHSLVSKNQKYLFTSCQRQNEIKIWDIQNKANVCTINTKTISTTGSDNFYFDVNSNSKDITIFFPEIKKIVIYDFYKRVIISEYDLGDALKDPYNRIFYIDQETVYLVDNNENEFEILKYNLKTKTKKTVKKYPKKNQLNLNHFEKTKENIVCFFTDSTNFIVQSSNDQLLLKLKKTESFNNIAPTVSNDEHYVAVNFLDSITIYNTKTMSRQIIDSTQLIYRDAFPTLSRFSDDSKKLFYLDNNNGSIEKNLIVVYDVEQQKIINKMDTDEKKGINSFYVSKEQVFATKYHEIYSGYLFQNKLNKSLKGLERQTSSFLRSDHYWISGFDNGSIKIFNTQTGENNILKIANTPKKYAPIINILHFNQTAIVVVKKQEDLLLYKIDLPNLKVLDSIEIFDNAKFQKLSIDEKKETLWLKIELNDGVSIGGKLQTTIKNFLFDIKTFKEIPLFENQNYNTLYYTHDRKEIVGYVAQKGSYVYDSNNYKFIKFIPNSLYFKHKEDQYNISKETKDKLVKDYDVPCDKCENGYQLIDSIFKIPTGRLVLKKEGVSIVEFDNFNKNPKSDDDFFDFQVIQNNHEILFKKNGFEAAHIDLEKQHIFVPVKTPKYVFKYNNPPFYLKFDISDTQPIRNVLKSKSLNFKVSDTIQFSIYNINYVNERSYITKELTGEFESWSNKGFDSYGNMKIELFEKPKDGYINSYSEDSDDLHAFEKMELKLHSLIPNSFYKEKQIGINKDFYKIPAILLENKVYLNKAKTFKINSHHIKFNKRSASLIALNEDNLFDEDSDTLPFNYNLSNINSFYNWTETETSNLYYFSWDDNQLTIKGSYKDKSKVNFNFIFLEDNNYIIFFDDNYYMATKEIFDFLWFSEGDKIYRPEQFDLKFNRPDIVMKRLGFADPATIQFFKNLYMKRLKKIGIEESQLSNSLDLPTLKIENFEKLDPIINSKEIGLNLQLKDSKYRLKSINIWINNTPVYGKNGMDLSKLKAKKTNKSILLPLANGNNKIQISVLNEIGLESLKETIYITSNQSDVKENLYLIALGVSEFENKDYNLKYAAKDASDVKNLFAQSKLYANVYAKTLLNNEVTQKNVLELDEFLKNATVNDVVIVYIASHGLLDPAFNYYIASHNIDFHNPIKNGIAYESIENLLDKIKPLKKIMFIDACHSGEVDLEEIESTDNKTASDQEIAKRGATPLNVKKKTVDQLKALNAELFSDLRRGNGTTIISSAGGLEYALESDKWKNGLFTYCLINGLLSKKADLDTDGNIMLSEIQSYVSAQVKELSHGLQQPTFRLQNLANDYQIW